MSFFKNLRNKHTVTTLYKYFISYFLLLTILTLGYTAAFRVQLKKVYTKELHNQAEKQLTDIDNDLYSSISTIEKIQYLLAQDIPLAMSRYLKAFHQTPVDHSIILPGVVSRKKQLIPAFMSALQQ